MAGLSPNRASKLGLKPGQRRVYDLPDRPKRMIHPNPRLQIDIAEKFATPLVAAAHHDPHICTGRWNHLRDREASAFFNSLLDALLTGE
jgi:hypothetical protein